MADVASSPIASYKFDDGDDDLPPVPYRPFDQHVHDQFMMALQEGIKDEWGLLRERCFPESRRFTVQESRFRTFESMI